MDDMEDPFVGERAAGSQMDLYRKVEGEELRYGDSMDGEIVKLFAD